MRKLAHLLIIVLALVLLLSLVSCGTPTVEYSTDDPIDQQQTEEKKNQDNKTDQLQEKEKEDLAPENVLTDKEQKDAAPIVTPSGSHNTGSSGNSGVVNTTKPNGSNTGIGSGSNSNSGSSVSSSSGSSTTKPNDSNTGSNSGAASTPKPSDSNTNNNTGSSDSSGTSSGSTSNNESDSHPSSGTESDLDNTGFTPVHEHNWTDTETVVVCYDCGTIHHVHNWEPTYTTEIVDDYEMKCITRCVHCGVDIGTGADAIAHVYEEMDKGNSGQTRDAYEQVKVGSREEQVLTGYVCSICDAQKTAEGNYAENETSHSHVWENAETVVVCFECGEIDHAHIWEPHYTTEVIEDYEMQSKHFCSTCDEDITELLAGGASMKQHRKETGCTSSGYYGTAVQVHVGSHEEQVLLGYSCSICGAIQ